MARLTPPAGRLADAGSDLGAGPFQGPRVEAPGPGVLPFTASCFKRKWGPLAWRRKPEKPCRIVAVDIVVSPDAPPDCEASCPVGALRVKEGVLEADASLCTVCLACMALCGPEKVKVVPSWRCPEDDA